eukprot:m51a1_g6634 hypothetical protein (109) ;mRNA; r:91896-92275
MDQPTTVAECLVSALPCKLWLRVLSYTSPDDVRSFSACSTACRDIVRDSGRELAARVAARQLLAEVPPSAQEVEPSALPRSLRIKGPLFLVVTPLRDFVEAYSLWVSP